MDHCARCANHNHDYPYSRKACEGAQGGRTAGRPQPGLHAESCWDPDAFRPSLPTAHAPARRCHGIGGPFHSSHISLLAFLRHSNEAVVSASAPASSRLPASRASPLRASEGDGFEIAPSEPANHSENLLEAPLFSLLPRAPSLLSAAALGRKLQFPSLPQLLPTVASHGCPGGCCCNIHVRTLPSFGPHRADSIRSMLKPSSLVVISGRLNFLPALSHRCIDGGHHLWGSATLDPSLTQRHREGGCRFSNLTGRPAFEP